MIQCYFSYPSTRFICSITLVINVRKCIYMPYKGPQIFSHLFPPKALSFIIDEQHVALRSGVLSEKLSVSYLL